MQEDTGNANHFIPFFSVNFSTYVSNDMCFQRVLDAEPGSGKGNRDGSEDWKLSKERKWVCLALGKTQVSGIQYLRT